TYLCSVSGSRNKSVAQLKSVVILKSAPPMANDPLKSSILNVSSLLIASNDNHVLLIVSLILKSLVKSPLISLGLFFARSTFCLRSSKRLIVPSAGFAFFHISDCFHSSLLSNSYKIGRKESSLNTPSTTLQLYS